MKNLRRILCLTLALLMAVSVMATPAFADNGPPISFANNYTTIQKWLNPEAEAYFKTLVTSASRVKYQKTARVNGWLVGTTLYDGTYGINDTAKAWYKTHDFYPTTGYAADTFQNETLISGLYCRPTPKGYMTADYFGRNAWRGSSIERLTMERMCLDLEPDHTFTYSDKTTGASYTWDTHDARMALFGHRCVIFEEYAFADCKNLKTVVFTTECDDLYIAPTAFSNCPNLTITAPVGGKIEAFCKAHGIKFQPYNIPPFTDAKTNRWYSDAVKWVYQAGLMTGTSATTFAPDEKLTNAQAVQVLYNQAGQPDFTRTNKVLNDVEPGKWYTRAAEWAAHTGLLEGIAYFPPGYRRGDFWPNVPCQRGMLAILLYNQAGQPDVTGMENPFTDVKPSEGYKVGQLYKAVVWAYHTGLITGLDATTFGPSAHLTRAQMAVILWRQAGSPVV